MTKWFRHAVESIGFAFYAMVELVDLNLPQPEDADPELKDRINGEWDTYFVALESFQSAVMTLRDILYHQWERGDKMNKRLRHSVETTEFAFYAMVELVDVNLPRPEDAAPELKTLVNDEWHDYRVALEAFQSAIRTLREVVR